MQPPPLSAPAFRDAHFPLRDREQVLAIAAAPHSAESTHPLPPRETAAPNPIAGGVGGAFAVLVVTVGLWAVMVVLVLVNRSAAGVTEPGAVAAITVYLLLSTLLSFATVMHLLARLGGALRFRAHTPDPIERARTTVRRNGRSLTVLVPSYREEPAVIRRTLLSAALLEYPGTRVVLLVDDPPSASPGTPDAALLASARSMATLVEGQLEPVRHRVAASYGRFLEGYGSGAVTHADVDVLHACVAEAASHLRRWAREWGAGDHGDRLFAEEVLLSLAGRFEAEAHRLQGALAASGSVRRSAVASVYTMMLDVFSADVATFERKRYANLSHEPNKAMNLNSYLGLMGRAYVERESRDGRLLIQDDSGPLFFGDSDYVLTLDADSVILPDYALRLVHILEQPSHSRMAVAQTPYSAFPGATTELERIAGATTDVQYLLHQGMTHFGATFWVGANAVLRKTALDDIATTTVESGHPITRYIQDRTVIEDTESSIDLLIRGWSLLNVPERLAYSATPPDFGSLIIQRRRWANGGLIILPKLVRLLRERRRRGEGTPLPGLLLQFHYLTSMPVVATGLLLLLLVPTRPLEGIVTPWLVPLLAAPYLVVHAADLRRNGYRASDTFRVYALNMLLVAVNLAGGLRSIQQAVNGTKAPFLRTPKISNRVSAPAYFIVFPAVLGVQGVVVSVTALVTQGSVLALYSGLTAVITLYGLQFLVGGRHAVEDVGAGLRLRVRSLRGRSRPRPAASALVLDQHPPVPFEAAAM